MNDHRTLMMSASSVIDLAQPPLQGQASDYSLPAEFGIYAAAQTQHELLSSLIAWAQDSDRKTVRINGAAVDSLDASGIQILMALHRSLCERGLNLQICDASTVLHQGLQRLGAHRLLAHCL